MNRGIEDWSLVWLALGLGLFGLVMGMVIANESIHARLADDSILINCVQVGEETLNGETSTFYTCEGIR